MCTLASNLQARPESQTRGENGRPKTRRHPHTTQQGPNKKQTTTPKGRSVATRPHPKRLQRPSQNPSSAIQQEAEHPSRGWRPSQPTGERLRPMQKTLKNKPRGCPALQPKKLSPIGRQNQSPLHRARMIRRSRPSLTSLLNVNAQDNLPSYHQLFPYVYHIIR